MDVSREQKWYLTHNSKSDLPLVNVKQYSTFKMTYSNFRAHRAFQMRRISDVDIIGNEKSEFRKNFEKKQKGKCLTLQIPKETSV